MPLSDAARAPLPFVLAAVALTLACACQGAPIGSLGAGAGCRWGLRTVHATRRVYRHVDYSRYDASFSGYAH